MHKGESIVLLENGRSIHFVPEILWEQLTATSLLLILEEEISLLHARDLVGVSAQRRDLGTSCEEMITHSRDNVEAVDVTRPWNIWCEEVISLLYSRALAGLCAYASGRSAIHIALLCSQDLAEFFNKADTSVPLLSRSPHMPASA